MLLITRREGEGIMVNGTIEVKVLEVRGGRVKLGFEFPPGNSVYRQELFAKIQAENMAAAVTPSGSNAAVGNVLKSLGQAPASGSKPPKIKNEPKGSPHGNPEPLQRNANESPSDDDNAL